MAHSYVHEFHASMNEHRNATYKAVPPYVVELERLSHRIAPDGADDKAHLRIWARPSGPGADPRDDRWTKRFDEYGGYVGVSTVYQSISDRESAEELIERDDAVETGL